jgi:hypothetical protein
VALVSMLVKGRNRGISAVKETNKEVEANTSKLPETVQKIISEATKGITNLAKTAVAEIETITNQKTPTVEATSN